MLLPGRTETSLFPGSNSLCKDRERDLGSSVAGECLEEAALVMTSVDTSSAWTRLQAALAHQGLGGSPTPALGKGDIALLGLDVPGELLRQLVPGSACSAAAAGNQPLLWVPVRTVPLARPHTDTQEISCPAST